MTKRWTKNRFNRAVGENLGKLKVSVAMGQGTRIKRGSVSVIIWPDNTITRGDVDLSLCNQMTWREAAEALDIGNGN